MGTCQEGNKLSSTMKPNSHRGHISTSIVIIKRKIGRSLSVSETPQKLSSVQNYTKRAACQTGCISSFYPSLHLHLTEVLHTYSNW